MAQTSDSSAEGSGKFAKLSEEFIREMRALSPSSASRPATASLVDPKTGKIVALDALLDEVSAAGIAKQRRVYAQCRERFHAETPLASLRTQNAADWRLIDNHIGLSFWSSTTFRTTSTVPPSMLRQSADEMTQGEKRASDEQRPFCSRVASRYGVGHAMNGEVRLLPGKLYAPLIASEGVMPSNH